MNHALPIKKDAAVRLCFISYRHLTQLARSILEEYADRADIEVIDASFYSALGQQAITPEGIRVKLIEACPLSVTTHYRSSRRVRPEAGRSARLGN